MNRLQLFLSATFITAAYLGVLPKAPASDKKQSPVTSGDYIHSGILQALPDLDSFDLQEEITNRVSRAGSVLDLSNFTYVSTKITKADLKALAAPPAINRIRDLLLHNLSLDDTALEAVSGMHLMRIDIANTRVVDLHAIRAMQSLTEVFANHTKLGTAGMQVLAQLHNLASLNLCETNVSDSDLMLLGESKNIKSLYCIHCPKLTKSGLHKLKAKLPGCRFHTEESRHFTESNYRELVKIEKGLMGVSEYALADRAAANLLQQWEARVGERDYQSICNGYNVRAKCQQELNHPKEAREFFTKALSLATEHNLGISDIQSSFALFCEQQKDFATARKIRALPGNKTDSRN